MKAVCYYKNFDKMYDVHGESGDVRFIDASKFSGEIEYGVEKVYIEEENDWIREVYNVVGIEVEVAVKVETEVKKAAHEVKANDQSELETVSEEI